MLYARDYAADGKGAVPLGTLTSVTVTDVLSCRGSVGHVFAIKAIIPTSGTSVTVRMEGSVNNVDWFNLDEEGNDTVIMDSRTVQLQYIWEVPYIRGRIVAYEGTAPTVVFSDSIRMVA